MKLPVFSLALLTLASTAGTAQAQDVYSASTYDWRGFYAGVNIGGAWNSTCNTWSLNSANPIPPALINAFYNRDCPNNGVFVGGAQIGYNFQHEQWVWGFGLDYDIWSAKDRNRSFAYVGSGAPGALPSGTVNFSGKVSPNGFGILGPRIGYAVENWLPYFRIGSVLTGGSRTSSATYTEAGDSTPTSFFSGGKNFKSNGFGIGAGLDVALGDPWFLRAEYTHVNLGKGTNTATSCTPVGSAACAAFGSDALELDNIHNSFTANIFRVGINYKFGHREAPSAPAPAAAYVAPPPPPPPPPTPPPPPPPKPVSLCPGTPPGVAVDKYGCPCDVSQEVHFATDSAVLTEQDQALLDTMIVNMKRLNFVDGEVGGYTDSTGSAAYNQGLSERRAQAVAEYLTSHGISGGRLTVKGYGESNPVADNATAAGRAHNRRVVLHRTDCTK